MSQVRQVKKGDIVKVRIQDGTNSERIWAQVIDVDAEKQSLKVKLINEPISSVFKLGEEFELPVSFVLDFYAAT